MLKATKNCIVIVVLKLTVIVVLKLTDLTISKKIKSDILMIKIYYRNKEFEFMEVGKKL